MDGPGGSRPAEDPEVEWNGGGVAGTSPVGLEGYCEFMEVDPGVEIIADIQEPPGDSGRQARRDPEETGAGEEWSN